MTNVIVDVNKRVEQFIALRDKIDEMKERHKQELAPLEDAKKLLEAWFLQYLQDNNLQNAKTGAGTVSIRQDASATVADGEAFRLWIIENDAFQFADIRANKTTVREFVEKEGVPPPGVNFSIRQAIGCRRA
jgi:hypothetical protein